MTATRSAVPLDLPTPHITTTHRRLAAASWGWLILAAALAAPAITAATEPPVVRVKYVIPKVELVEGSSAMVEKEGVSSTPKSGPRSTNSRTTPT